MGRYAAKRLIELVPTVVGVVAVVFFVVRLIPGDPATLVFGENATADVVQRLRDQMNLDEPMLVAWFDYLKSVMQGDLGDSLVRNVTVRELVASALPVTLILATASLIVAVTVGVAVGTAAAYLSSRGHHFLDHALSSAAIALEATPKFVVALVAMLVFVLQLGWFPATGVVDLSSVTSTFRRLALPVIVSGLAHTATIARVTRTSVLEVLGEDYVRAARAVGESSISALHRHALRNAIIPVITVIGLSFGSLLGGSIVIEVIFSLPGLGNTLVSAVSARDYPVVQSVVLIYAGILLLVNLGTDLLYRRADPRVVLK